jgi:hypothetical protein
MTPEDQAAVEAVRASAAGMQARLRELADRHPGGVPWSITYRALAAVDVVLDAVADLDMVLRQQT